MTADGKRWRGWRWLSNNETAAVLDDTIATVDPWNSDVPLYDPTPDPDGPKNLCLRMEVTQYQQDMKWHIVKCDGWVWFVCQSNSCENGAVL